EIPPTNAVRAPGTDVVDSRRVRIERRRVGHAGCVRRESTCEAGIRVLQRAGGCEADRHVALPVDLNARVREPPDIGRLRIGSGAVENRSALGDARRAGQIVELVPADTVAGGRISRKTESRMVDRTNAGAGRVHGYGMR